MAAGLGFKDFTTGEVLTAADVDGYLMQGVWVFASAAARDAAVTSPQEGNFAYLKDTNVTTYYTGSAWANLDTTGMTNPMTTTGDTIYSSSGSTPARLGIGTAGQVLTVNSGATAPEWAAPASGGGYTLLSTTSLSGATVNITGISGSYKHLQIFITGVYGAGNDVQSRLRFNNDSGSNYDYGAVGVRIGNGDVISSRSGLSSTSTQGVSGYTGTAFNQKNYMLIDIPRYTDTSPHFFAWTLWSVDNSTTTNWISWTGNGIYSTSSAISEINLITQYANFSGGTVYIYGVN